jgi:hypothetical protein
MSSQLSTINVPPSTTPNQVRTTLHTEIREPVPSPGGEGQGEGGTAVLDFVASDESLDRCNEIISASGWKLENYKRNPVFQNAHQYGDILFTLGRALITEIRVGKTSTSSQYLFQRIEFACDINPMAKIAYGLYKGKFLNAVSVGFVPLRWEDGSSESSSSSSSSSIRRRYLEQELLEVSAVGIPANPNALALGLKSGAIAKSDLRDLSDLINLTLSDHQPSTLNHQLVKMAKQLHSILRS